MRDFIISTDSTADLPDSFIEQHRIAVHPLYYIIDGVQYGGANDIPRETFFKMMREGSIPTTSATNPDVILNMFSAQVKEGFDVLHLGFSSGLSCSFNNASVMAREVCEENPGARIEVVDTLCASLGLGLLVYYAVRMKEEGRTMDEIIEWINANKLRICHQFTVEDLKYLWRGGRISKTVAILGTLINVKPVLHMNNEGKLIPLNNVRGRKKSLTALVDNMAEQMGDARNDCVFISHGDCPEDAAFVAGLVRERFGIDCLITNAISPTIGAHSGPGTVALFHLGTSRETQKSFIKSIIGD